MSAYNGPKIQNRPGARKRRARGWRKKGYAGRKARADARAARTSEPTP